MCAWKIFAQTSFGFAENDSAEMMSETEFDRNFSWVTWITSLNMKNKNVCNFFLPQFLLKDLSKTQWIGWDGVGYTVGTGVAITRNELESESDISP